MTSTEAFTPFHRGGSGAPLVLLHGFTDTWRTWELVLPELEQQFDVFAPTLAGHAGGPPIPVDPDLDTLIDFVEAALDEQGIEKAHIAGNSLGGYLALHLAARGRAESVVALAPAGGWAVGDESFIGVLDNFVNLKSMVVGALPHVDAMVASPEGRRAATQLITVNYEHIPADLVAHQVRGVAACEVDPFIDYVKREGWALDAASITCPVSIVWGTSDLILPPGVADLRFHTDWLPQAEYVSLENIGHCIQLDDPAAAARLIAEGAAA